MKYKKPLVFRYLLQNKKFDKKKQPDALVSSDSLTAPLQEFSNLTADYTFKKSSSRVIEKKM